MNKKELCFIAVLLWISFVILLPRVVFAQDSQKQISTEQSISGFIKEIKPIFLEKRAAPPPSTQPGQPPKPSPCEEPSIRTDVKEYVITLQNLSERYKIVLAPATAIKVGDKDILPQELKEGDHFLKVTYKCGEDKNILITSVALEKVKAPFGIKFWSLLLGLAATILLVLFSNNILKKCTDVKGGLFIGFDNRYSNSKVQMVIWTFLVVFSYLTIYAERALATLLTNLSFSSLIDIPENLGIVMGISAGSFVGAKAITSAKASAGVIANERGNNPSLTDLITNNSKTIDLGDAQMFIWTLIAMGIYLVNVLRMWWFLDPSVEFSLPNVDSTLLILTGVSQAAYVGKKLVTRDEKPTIKSVDPAAGAKANDTIIINGAAFGSKEGDVSLGKISIKIVVWYDSIIHVRIVAKSAEVSIPTEKTVLCVKTAFDQIVTVPFNVLPKSGK